MEGYYTVCYVSKAAPELTKADLTQLFEYSTNSNIKSGVTGILLHSLGNFFQVLEGREEYIMNLYDKIKIDKRHTDIFTVFNKKTINPTFLKYDSKFNVVKSKEDLQFIKNYLDDNSSYSTNEKLSRLLMPFLMQEKL
jgi:hypothetical protein